jgi:hypothetical protein
MILISCINGLLNIVEEKQNKKNNLMEKRSTHWLDAFVWVRNVYLSAVTKEQEIAAERLLLNFERLYKDKDTLKMAWDLRDEYLKSMYKKK